MYVVCKTPVCQRTMLIDEVRNIWNEGYIVHCDRCNGILVEADGSARMSALRSEIPVVGNYQLNVLYLEDELFSMKVRLNHGIISYPEMSFENFTEKLKEELQKRHKIDIYQYSLDNKRVNTGIFKMLAHHGIVSRGKSLRLAKTKGEYYD